MDGKKPTRMDSELVRQAAYSVGQTAHLLGVATPTLRSWEMRYGLGPSLRSPGGHRRYTTDDLTRLRVMHRLTQVGIPAAEAAQVARDTPLSELASVRGADRTAPAPTIGPSLGAAAVRGLVRAARNMDGPFMVNMVRTAIERRGVIATWSEVLVPLLQTLGEDWERTGRGVDVEHLAAGSVATALRQAIAASAPPNSVRPVLLAAAEEEQHYLPLLALAAALAERTVEARVLGGRVPREALAQAIRRIGPAAVFLWSSLAETGGLDALDALPHTRPAPRVVLGGPGWADGDLPVGVSRAADLAEAATLLTAAARL